MRISWPLGVAVGGAIATLILFVWFYPNYILELGMAPNGATLRQVFQAQTVAELPAAIQALMKYQYPLAGLFSLGSFGAVYFGWSMTTGHRWIVALGCLMPIAGFWFIYPVLLWSLVLPGLGIWAVWLYRKSNQQLLKPYLYCLVLNGVAAGVLGAFLRDVFAIIA